MRKILGILLAVLFLVSLSATAVSAACDSCNNWWGGCKEKCDSGCKDKCDWGCKDKCDRGCKDKCDWGCKDKCDWGCKDKCDWGCKEKKDDLVWPGNFLNWDNWSKNSWGKNSWF